MSATSERSRKPSGALSGAALLQQLRQASGYSTQQASPTTKKTTRGRSRARKNSSAPKRPLSAYVFFVSSERPKVMKEYPEKTFRDTARIIARRWKELTKAERAPYEAKARQEKKRYEAQKLEHIRSQSRVGSVRAPARTGSGSAMPSVRDDRSEASGVSRISSVAGPQKARRSGSAFAPQAMSVSSMHHATMQPKTMTDAYTLALMQHQYVQQQRMQLQQQLQHQFAQQQLLAAYSAMQGGMRPGQMHGVVPPRHAVLASTGQHMPQAQEQARGVPTTDDNSELVVDDGSSSSHSRSSGSTRPANRGTPVAPKAVRTPLPPQAQGLAQANAVSPQLLQWYQMQQYNQSVQRQLQQAQTHALGMAGPWPGFANSAPNGNLAPSSGRLPAHIAAHQAQAALVKDAKKKHQMSHKDTNIPPAQTP